MKISQESKVKEQLSYENEMGKLIGREKKQTLIKK